MYVNVMLRLVSHVTLRHRLNEWTACSKLGYGCKWTWDYPTLHLDTV